MESTMTTERMIEQTEKQIAELENWNKLLLDNCIVSTMHSQAEQVRHNILTIRELSTFLRCFSGKMIECRIGENVTAYDAYQATQDIMKPDFFGKL